MQEQTIASLMDDEHPEYTTASIRGAMAALGISSTRQVRVGGTDDKPEYSTVLTPADAERIVARLSADDDPVGGGLAAVEAG